FRDAHTFAWSRGEGRMKRTQIYGMMAEFDTPDSIVHAARLTHQAGYRRIDAYSPFPIEALAEAIDFHPTDIPLVVLVGGSIGGVSGFFWQYWIHVINYPINVGGRPLNSWPAFIVVTFEMTILFAGIFAVLGMLALNGLPMPYHPVFNVPRFVFASKDRFFLIIFSSDPKYEPAERRKVLQQISAGPNHGLRAFCRPAGAWSSTSLDPRLTPWAAFWRRFAAHTRRASILLMASFLPLAACRQDMHDQPRFKPLRESDFYADLRSARPPVEGTVARGQLHEDAYFYGGKIGNNPGDYMPFAVTADVLARCQERYNI